MLVLDMDFEEFQQICEYCEGCEHKVCTLFGDEDTLDCYEEICPLILNEEEEWE